MDEPAASRYDLFIAHAEADRAWVAGYLKPALGVEPGRLFTPRDFDLTATVPAEFERAVTSSRFTALVLSPAFLADRWAEFGAQLVQFASVEEGRFRLVAIRLHPADLPLGLRFRVALDCTDRSQWDEQIGRLRDLLDRPEPVAEEIPCPYPGMVPFRAEDARFFHGREDEIQSLLGLIRHHRFLLVIGPSGSGKSSLVTAGLLPRLVDPKHFPRGTWRSLTMRPGEQPLGRLRDLLGGDPGRPEATLSALLAAGPPAQRLLLVVDQLEELFALVRERAEQDRFIAALKALRSDARCTLIATMRADFYGDLMTSALWPVDRSQVFDVSPLRGDALRGAIVRPAEAVGVSLEPDLVERLIADAADEPGALPMLQEALVLLWGRRDRRLLTRIAYESLGREGRSGLAVAMATKADATLAELPPEEQRIARRIFLRLVQFGEGRPDTRRQLSVEELRSASDAPGRFEAVLDHLIRNRLLTPGVDEARGRRVDIAHEMLIAGWPSSQEWVRARRDAEQTRRRLEEKADEWGRLGRGEGGLLDAAELPEAERWLSGPDAQELGIDADLEALVLASRAALDRSEREREAVRRRELEDARRLAEERGHRERIFRNSAIALGSLLVFLVIVTALALVARSQAERQARIATAERLASQSRVIFKDLPAQALLLAVESVKALREGDPRVPAAEQALQDAIVGMGGTGRLVRDYAGAVGSAESNSAKAIGIGGRRFAAAGRDGVARVWELADPRDEPRVLRHEAPVVAVALSGDGRWLATAARDDVARVWDLDHPATEPLARRVPGGDLTAVALSGDGRRLVSAGTDGTARVWDLDGPRDKSRDFRHGQGWIGAARLSADGRRLAILGSFGAIQVWDLEGSDHEPRRFNASGSTFDVALSADGRWLAATDPNGAARWYDLEDPKAEPQIPMQFPQGQGQKEAEIAALSLSADGMRVATVHLDNAARVRDLGISVPGAPPPHAVGEPRSARVNDLGRYITPHSVRGHDGGNGGIFAALLSSDGRWLVTGGTDGAARVWDLDNLEGQPRSLGGPVNSVAVAMSADARWLATAGHDGGARVYDLNDPTASPLFLIYHGSPVLSAALGADGRRLATAGQDKVIRVWELQDRVPQPRVFSGHEAPVHAVALSTDGRWLASAGEDRTARVWDLEGRSERAVHVLPGHEGTIRDAALSGDGRRLVTAGDDGTARVWDLSSAHPEANPAVLRHPGGVVIAALSSDGRRLVTTGLDKKARVWDVGDPNAPPLTLAGSFEFTGYALPSGSGSISLQLGTAAMSGDGRWLASATPVAGEDRIAMGVWDLSDPKAEPRIIRGHGMFLFGAALSGDGLRLATVGVDGIARVSSLDLRDWVALAGRMAGRNLTNQEWQRFIPGRPYRKTFDDLPGPPDVRE